MLSLEKMLKIDPELADMNEADLLELRTALYEHAQLAFETYWTKKYGSKNPTGLLPNQSKNAKI